MGNSAHSNAWHGSSSRGNRLSRKLGVNRLDLDRLDTLLSGRECAYCHETHLVRWHRRAEEYLCSDCWLDVQEGYRTERGEP